MTQAAQFSQVKCGDYTNTLQEISAYVRSANVPQSHADTNVTTFAAGGGMVTEGHQKGAIQSQVTVECFMDPALLLILTQIMAAPGGSTWQFIQGANAAPTFGDQMFQGTYTLFGMSLAYNTGQEAVWTLDLRPTDGGSIIPAWYPA